MPKLQLTREVWYAIPCANEPMARKTLPAWKAQGYKIAVIQDRHVFKMPEMDLHVVMPPYRGYYASGNYLAKHVVPKDAPVVVFGGDDMYPDPKRTASQILDEYLAACPDLDVVMQPVGDDLEGTNRICGSPWIGRGWLDRSYRGLGPYCGDYFHFYGDEELHELAKSMGKLWQRQDLAHRHDHWTRKGGPAPDFYKPIQPHWGADQSLFNSRKARGWPYSEMLTELQAYGSTRPVEGASGPV